MFLHVLYGESLAGFVLPGVSKLLASLGHIGRRVVLGHTFNTQTPMETKKNLINVLSKFTILYWATFIAILGHMWPLGHRLDTPECLYSHLG